jgi:hypothetical protein
MSAQPLPGTPLPVAGMSATPMPSVAGSYGTPGGAPLFPAAGLGSGAPTVPVRPVQVVQPAAVAVAVPAAPVPIDPIAEAPEAIWYVRPPSGGQYGPARGEIMRKWVAEGRVSADSLVWREGWDDWRTGGEAFPVLRSTTPPVPGPIAYAPSGVPTSAARVPVRRRSSLPLAITTVVVLGFLALGLLITLVFVIRS